MNDPGQIEVEYVITERIQYKVRNIRFEGNEKLSNEQLLQGMQLLGGKPYGDLLRSADAKTLQQKYTALGCIDVSISPEPKFTDEDGVVDLIYKNVLARPSDPAGADYWVRQLNSGRLSRAQVMIGFSESNEFKTKLQPQVITTVAYAHMLDRMPTTAEIVAPAAGTAPGLDYFARLYWLIIDSHDYQARGLTP